MISGTFLSKKKKLIINQKGVVIFGATIILNIVIEITQYQLKKTLIKLDHNQKISTMISKNLIQGKSS